MSLTLAAPQPSSFPSSYLPRPWEHERSFAGLDVKKRRDAVHDPAQDRASAHHTRARWSQDSVDSDSFAEDRPMSTHGRSLGSTPNDSYRSSSSFPPLNASPANTITTPPHSGSDRLADGVPAASPVSSPTRAIAIAQSIEAPLDSRRPRLSGVHSILNPASHGDEDAQRRRTQDGETDGEVSAEPTTPAGRGAPATHFGRHVYSDPASPTASLPTPSGNGTGHGALRRILTPISPKGHRAATLGQLPGTIDAAVRPFLTEMSRIRAPEHPAINDLAQQHAAQSSHVTQRSPFIVPAAPTPPLIAAPRRASVSVVGSARPSPTPSYADSYSQNGASGQNSPAMDPVPGAPLGPTPTRALRSPSLTSLGSVPPASLENEQGFHHGTLGTSGQSYQLLTVDTSKGHMTLPVEVQAASRMADEKRKRNAGASARFRARRKEKEREAAGKISNLEHDLQYAQEDARHYKNERDQILDLLVRSIPQSQYDSFLKNRPASPRHKRIPHLQRPPINAMDSPRSTVSSEQYESEEPPATRRKTEHLHQHQSQHQHQHQHQHQPQHQPQHQHQHQTQYQSQPRSQSQPPHSVPLPPPPQQPQYAGGSYAGFPPAPPPPQAPVLPPLRQHPPAQFPQPPYQPTAQHAHLARATPPSHPQDTVHDRPWPPSSNLPR